MIEVALAARPGDARADAFRRLAAGEISVHPVSPDGAGAMGGESAGRIAVVGQGISPEPLLESGAAPEFVQFLECQPVFCRLPAGDCAAVMATPSPALAPIAAEFALGLAASVTRAGRMPRPVTREGVVALAGDDQALSALKGVTAGIIGMGRAGEALSQLLSSAGCEVLYQDRRTARQTFTTNSAARRNTLDRLLVNSEFVFVTVPWGPTSDPAIGEREVRLLDHSATVVSVSDPRVIHVASLREAVAAGEVMSAAIDAPAHSLPASCGEAGGQGRFVVTPGFATDFPPAHEGAAGFAVENVLRFASGEPVQGVLEILDYPRTGDPAFWSSQMSPRQS